jgi:hypothetical protein
LKTEPDVARYHHGAHRLHWTVLRCAAPQPNTVGSPAKWPTASSPFSGSGMAGARWCFVERDA